MNQAIFLSACLLSVAHAVAQPNITRFTRNGDITVTNTCANGVCTLKQAGIVTGPYLPVWQVFPSQTEITRQVAPSGFYRA
ncbi:MAG: hypothetical protein HZA90_26810 [Verrucomicrobia bacterium]|nr:hypothetical protein [Verrucomicrobiota bacterium]